MNSKLKRNWWIDVIIFTGFTTTFFLDLTGIAVHQWIGVFCGILAIYHLFLHRDWMLAASARFFGKTTNQSRLYYALDLTLLFGFSLILITGLVISTWLNPSLGNFSAWLNIHIAISMITLLAVLLKLTLHWRWIVHTTRKLWASPAVTPANPLALQPVIINAK
ncbi:MAG: hypothetical protein CVU41_12310 [Chloroflexi bacterium HGW-Chloroflexi-3]|nr:MAG: hypothetical protein CVU41_12310 [Chloroflexi bacterium HGW-Chloroflexi-3]